MLKYAAVLAAVLAMTATGVNAQQTTTSPGCTPQQAGGAGVGNNPARGQPAGGTACE